MQKKLIAVTLLSILLLAGCSLFNNDTDTSEDFYPLTVGNYWNYQMDKQITVGDSVVKDTLIHMRNEVTEKVTLNNGEKAYAMKRGATDSLYAFAVFGNTTSYIVKKDTAYFEYDSLAQSEGKYMAPTDIAVGSEWDTDTSHVVVVSEDSVEVPAGDFYAYKMASIVNGDTLWQWVAKGVGLIKMEGTIPIDSVTMQKTTIRLMEYNVK